MIEMIMRLLNNFDAVKAFMVSISSAIFGTVLGFENNSSLLLNQVPDPIWFCLVKPYFQIAAWSIAILAGAYSFIKAIEKDKEKNKTKKK